MTAVDTLTNKIISVEWNLDDMVLHICYTFLGAVYDQLGHDNRWMQILALAIVCICKSCFVFLSVCDFCVFVGFDEFGDVCGFCIGEEAGLGKMSNMSIS